MSYDRLKEVADKVVARQESVRGKGEQATRQAMILPFLEALGYDIWDTSEVCPEYEADTAIKKAGQKEKVDYALLLSGVPRIFIEVKPLGEILAPHAGQLARYFNSTTTVCLAIITDGMEYQFFTDTGEPNIQDAEPFFVSRLDGVDPGFDILANFSKPGFNPAQLRDLATDLKYTAKLEAFLRAELDLRDREPSEAFVRWLLSDTSIWQGRTTATVVTRFRPIAKQALVKVLRDVVRRSIAAIDHGVSAPASSAPAERQISAPDPATAPELPNSADAAVMTTPRELACFEIIKAAFESIPTERRRFADKSANKVIDAQLLYKDTASYFSVYVNRVSSWVVRIQIEQRRPFVVFELPGSEAIALLGAGFDVIDQPGYGTCRINIGSVDDLNALKPVVVRAIERLLVP
jgi:hypothetical protein